MSYKNITPGDKTGRAQTARFITSKNGTPGIEIQFALNEPSTGTVETLSWMGWLSKAALENTMGTLVDVLEFNGNDAFNEVDGVLTDPNALAYGKDVKLVVEIEEYNGKQYPKIKWVNRLGGSAFGNCEPQIIKSKLQEVGFGAAFLAAKQTSAQKVPF